MASDYNKIIHEYLNLKDKDTLRTLVGLDEADQNQLLAALTSKLYDKIVEKVADIDFGTIPRSRGDITKIENYASLMESIEIMRSIIVEYKEDTYPIDVVSTAVTNMTSRTKTFSKAFALNVEMPIILYNTITLAIVSSVSYLITGCIEYIKDPGSETYQIALDKVGYSKTAQNLLFEQLSKFNASCKNGELDQAIEDVIRNNRRLAECGGSQNDAMDGSTVIINIGGAAATNNAEDQDVDLKMVKATDPLIVKKGGKPFGKPPIPVIDKNGRAALHDDDLDSYGEAGPTAVLAPVLFAGKALITIAKVIIPILQHLVYFFYHSKQRISDYFAVQAELIQMNAYKLQYNTDIEETRRKKAYNSQMKIANDFKKVSNFFSIDYNKSKKLADDMSKAEEKKYTADDLGMPAPMPTSGQPGPLF